MIEKGSSAWQILHGAEQQLVDHAEKIL